MEKKTQNGSLLQFLTKKPERDAGGVAAFEERFRKSVADIFLSVVEDMHLHNHSEYWLKGGRGSCKSSFAGCEIFDMLERDYKGNALILRKVAGTLRDSVYSQMIWAMDTLGIAEEWECTVSPMEMRNKRTGQQILFRGLDEPRKIKSIRPRKGYFAVVWFEELEEFENYAEIRNVLQSAGRGKGARTIAIMSYNPPKSANNWVNKEALAVNSSRLVHHSIYTQVPKVWLGEVFIEKAEALRIADERAWRHEYGGEAIGEGGAVFANLKIRTITKKERQACIGQTNHGLDFGFSSDPSALVDTSYFETPDGKKLLYILRDWEKAGAGFDALERACKVQCGTDEIWADTEPRTIAELAGRGLRIAAARKGKKSREFGMQWLEDLTEIIIDPETAPNAAQEFAAFEHAKDGKGNWRADYQDGNDHTIDATRYSVWKIIFQNKRTLYFSGKGAR